MNELEQEHRFRSVAAGSNKSWLGSFWALLQAELSSYPGRPLLVFRIVLACTIVMFAIIVFRIPGGVVGAYYPLLISRDNLKSTKRSALWLAITCVLGTFEIVLSAMLFLGSPFLHLLWVGLSLFAVFYLISALRVYEAAVALGLFVTNTITIWDAPISAELRLHQVLFTLLAILVGCAVTVAIEYLFAHVHPPDAVIEGIVQRLDVTGEVLQHYVGTPGRRTQLFHVVHRYSERGTGTLRDFIVRAGYNFEEQQRFSTAVALAGRLVDLAATLMETARSISSVDRELCRAIDRNLLMIREGLSQGKTVQWIDIEVGHDASIPILIEIERCVELMAESLSQSIWEEAPRGDQVHIQGYQRFTAFVPDAFQSRKHVKFAVRGGLSALACYLFYMSVGWIGLSASVATCILTALPITGAARHKQLMRFAGVVLGACAIGFSAQTIVLPQIDSILSYTLLFASVILLGAWIATSGPRISYCGAQIVLAYELVNLNRFSLNPSLVPARDTVLGIILGIVTMWLIFDHLWATSSTESLRAMLRTTILAITELSIAPVAASRNIDQAHFEQDATQIQENLEKLRVLVDASTFEAFPKAIDDEILLQRTREYLPQLRATLLIKTGLIHHRALIGDYCQTDLVAEVDRRCSDLLTATAHSLDVRLPGRDSLSTNLDHQIQARLDVHAELIRNGELKCDLTELRLCSSLFNVIRHMTTNLSTEL